MLPTMNAADPIPRGQPKLKPSFAARLSTRTSVSGAMVLKVQEAMNHTGSQPPKPSGRAIAE